MRHHGRPIVVTATVREGPHAAATDSVLAAPAAAGPGWRLAQNSTDIVVAQIAQDGAAAEAGLSAGDVIVQVQQEKIAEPADVDRLIALARRHERRYIALLVQRKTEGLRWVGMSLE